MSHPFASRPGIIGRFQEAMAERGLPCQHYPEMDGQIHRFHIEGDKPGSKNGWYVLYDGRCPAGAFGSWKTGDKYRWSLYQDEDLTAEERIEQQRVMTILRARRDLQQQTIWQEMARECQSQWHNASEADPNHPYLRTKNVKAYGLRQNGNALLVPIYNERDEIGSLQYIWQAPDGSFHKRFKGRARKAGGLHQIGERGDRVYIAEGYATAATIYEQTGCCTIVAFDAGNLEAVLRRVHTADQTIIIAADNDTETPGNPGLTKAMALAEVPDFDISVVYPRFPAGSKGSDFNDLQAVDPTLVIEQLDAPVAIATGMDFVGVADLIRHPKPVHWLIKDFIEHDSLALIFGEPGCGKSFLALDISCCVATGIPWHGHPVARSGPVIYLAGEGHHGLARRLKAWDITHPGQLDKAPLVFSKCAVSLFDAESVTTVCTNVDRLIQKSGGEPPVLLVIDTLARNFGAGDENKTTDMNLFISHLDHYFRQRWGCCVLIVHHSGVQDRERARGNSALRGALDAQYQVVKRHNEIQLSTRKMKDAPEPDPLTFTLASKTLPWGNEYGEPESSCVLVRTQTKTVKSPSRLIDEPTIAMGKTQRACLRELERLCNDYRTEHPQDMSALTDVPVALHAWRDACIGSGRPLKDRKNFPRYRKQLIETGRIRLEGGFVYLVENNFES